MNILGTLLPLERILSIAMKLGILREPLKLIAGVYKKATGVRTQAKIAVAMAAYAAALMGAIPLDQAHQVATPLLIAAVPSLLEKINRILPVVEAGLKKVQEEANKPA